MATRTLWVLDPSKRFDLSDEEKKSALAAPETGPGYQVASRKTGGQGPRYLVFNGEVAVPITEQAGTSDGFEDDIEDVQLRWESDGFESYETFLNHPTAGAHPAHALAFPAAKAAPRGTLIVSTTTSATATTPVVRFTAYRNDRRVKPAVGGVGYDVAVDTYVMPEDDGTKYVSTGLGAVGRCALPNPFPASWYRWLDIPASTPVLVGTVRPNFGQAGGGVEIVLPALLGVRSPTPAVPSHNASW